MATQNEKAAAFARMHDQGCFILPNAWDMASAALIVDAGFPALATTSGGIAFAQGAPDGERLGRDAMLALAGEMARRFPVPVTADLEAGYGHTPDSVADTVRRAIALGLVGCNIEDSDPQSHRLYDVELAAARISAGVRAAEEAGLPDFVLNARTDPWIAQLGTQEENTAEAIRRANAYLAAGARCTFVPGPADSDTIAALAGEIRGPLNISANVHSAIAPSIDELEWLGVRRASLGSALMLASYGFARTALEHIKETGGFDYAVGSATIREMNTLIALYP